MVTYAWGRPNKLFGSSCSLGISEDGNILREKYTNKLHDFWNVKIDGDKWGLQIKEGEEGYNEGTVLYKKETDTIYIFFFNVHILDFKFLNMQNLWCTIPVIPYLVIFIILKEKQIERKFTIHYFH